MYVCMCACMYMNIYKQETPLTVPLCNHDCICICIYMCVCIHVRMYVYEYIQTRDSIDRPTLQS